MKNWKLVAAFAAILTGTAMPAHAEIDLSANFGIMSDYIYRGFHQSDGVANGGIDLAAGPFYLGTWIADLDSGNGIEIDVYGGLAFEFENGFSAYVGYTAYRYTEDDEGMTEAMVIPEKVISERVPAMETTGYKVTGNETDGYMRVEGKVYRFVPPNEGDTAPASENPHRNFENDGTYIYTANDTVPENFEYVGDIPEVPAVIEPERTIPAECYADGFDKDYDEINIGIGYAQGDFSASLDYSIGEHENFCAEDNDYDFASLTLDYKGAYVTFGTYGISEDDEDKGEPEGDYVEVGYATTINDIDFAVYLVDSDEDIDDETRLGMSVSYGFGL